MQERPEGRPPWRRGLANAASCWEPVPTTRLRRARCGSDCWPSSSRRSRELTHARSWPGSLLLLGPLHAREGPDLTSGSPTCPPPHTTPALVLARHGLIREAQNDALASVRGADAIYRLAVAAIGRTAGIDGIPRRAQHHGAFEQRDLPRHHLKPRGRAKPTARRPRHRDSFPQPLGDTGRSLTGPRQARRLGHHSRYCQPAALSRRETIAWPALALPPTLTWSRQECLL